MAGARKAFTLGGTSFEGETKLPSTDGRTATKSQFGKLRSFAPRSFVR